VESTDALFRFDDSVDEGDDVHSKRAQLRRDTTEVTDLQGISSWIAPKSDARRRRETMDVEGLPIRDWPSDQSLNYSSSAEFADNGRYAPKSLRRETVDTEFAQSIQDWRAEVKHDNVAPADFSSEVNDRDHPDRRDSIDTMILLGQTEMRQDSSFSKTDLSTEPFGEHGCSPNEGEPDSVNLNPMDVSCQQSSTNISSALDDTGSSGGNGAYLYDARMKNNQVSRTVDHNSRRLHKKTARRAFERSAH
jgi:hypothetical protein